jgi:hypothetical protein
MEAAANLQEKLLLDGRSGKYAGGSWCSPLLFGGRTHGLAAECLETLFGGMQERSLAGSHHS